MAHIKIRIGASMDSSVRRVLDDIMKMTNQSSRRIRAQMSRPMANAGPYRSAAREIDRSYRSQERAAERTARSQERSARRAATAQRRAAERTTREIERQAQRQQLAAERTADRFARRTSHRTTRFLAPTAPIAHHAVRGASGIARGLGVTPDIATQVSKSVEAEKVATSLSIQAYRPGEKGAPGIRQDPKKLISDARELAKTYGVDTNEVLQGQAAFTAQSGDLEQARNVSEDLVKLARSQGAELEKVFKAASKVNSALSAQPEYAENVQKRQKAIVEIIKQQIAQGKVGSIEMKELARDLPKLSGLTNFFGGDLAKTFARVQAVAQTAEGGQAKSTAQATTQTTALINDLTSGRVQKKLEKKGIRATDDQGNLRDLKDVIGEVLVATAGKDQLKELSALFVNKRSRAPLLDFAAKFRQAQQASLAAGGTQKESIRAGYGAVNAQFAKFDKTISDKQVNEDLAIVLNTTEAKAKKFQAQLQQVTADFVEKLLPALEKATPAIIKFAKTVGDVATWAIENPKKAIGAAIVASFARASIESALRAGIERMLLGSHYSKGGVSGGGGPLALPGAAGVNSRGVPVDARGRPLPPSARGFGPGAKPRASRVAGAAEGVGSAMMIASLAVTAMTVGMMTIDAIADASKKADKKDFADDARYDNVIGALMSQGATEQNRKDAEQLKTRFMQRKESSRDAVRQTAALLTGGTSMVGKAIMDWFGGRKQTLGEDAQGAFERATGAIGLGGKDSGKQLQELRDAFRGKELDSRLQVIDATLKNGLNVYVKSLPVPLAVQKGTTD